MSSNPQFIHSEIPDIIKSGLEHKKHLEEEQNRKVDEDARKISRGKCKEISKLEML